jgi:hypothetical protein
MIMYCEFEDTGEVFNNKKIYKCVNCHLKVALENPKTSIICFHYVKQELDQSLAKLNFDQNKNSKSPEDVVSQFIDKTSNIVLNNTESQTNTSLCSEEQIQERMNICKACEYFKDNSCLLCGCVVTRSKTYQNKLANKQASCPDNRWGPIS